MRRVLAIACLLSACGAPNAAPVDNPGDGGPTDAAPTGEPERIASYGALREALLAGEIVHAHFEYGRCQKTNGDPAPDAAANGEITTFELQPGSLEYAKSSLIWIYWTDGYQYLQNAARIHFDESGAVSIRAQYYDPKTFAIEMDEEFACGIDAAGPPESGQGVSLWKTPGAKRLANFTALQATLDGGKPAQALVDLSRCEVVVHAAASGAGPAIIEKIPFLATEYFAKGVVGNPEAYLAASLSELSLDGKDRLTSRYVKLRAVADDSSSLLILRNDPVTLQELSREEYRCAKAGDGNEGGVAFIGN